MSPALRVWSQILVLPLSGSVDRERMSAFSREPTEADRPVLRDLAAAASESSAKVKVSATGDGSATPVDPFSRPQLDGSGEPIDDKLPQDAALEDDGPSVTGLDFSRLRLIGILARRRHGCARSCCGPATSPN